ncbi:hypothetical protein LJC07_04940, partial [Christensenellaceae bacterium OttesenSCG-928-L17]|nr:hypothetical protein [Christensenellaceae bacterium OttesenSCG-928-L17]
MMNFLLTLAAGLVCGLLLFKLKVPGGMMLGAVLGAMLLGIFTQRAYMPAAAKLTAQITIGAF